MKTPLAEASIQSDNCPTTRWVFSGGSTCGSLKIESCKDETGLCDSSVYIDTGQPLLAGDRLAAFYLPSGTIRKDGPVTLIQSGGYLAGSFQIRVNSENLELNSYTAYKSILELIGSRSIYRFWNFVPEINHEEESFLENYKLFSSGRARAFSSFFGSDIIDQYPSASATGSSGEMLTVIFFSGHPPAENWENPEQTPAYCYPQAYGPHPPSFARASRFHDPESGQWIFISGTAAIKGSETQHLGNFEKQLDVTLNNIDLTLRQVGLGLTMQTLQGKCHFHAFLRDRRNLNYLEKRLKETVRPGDTWTIVEADICRKDLEVEIELTICGAR